MPRERNWKVPAICLFALGLSTALVGRPRCSKTAPGQDDSAHISVLSGHRFPIQAIAFAPQGNTLTVAAAQPFALGADEIEMADWEVATATRTARHTTAGQQVSHLSIAPQRRILASAEGCTVWLWDRDSGKRRLLGEHRHLVTALAFSPDGHLLASADSMQVIVWDMASGQQRIRLEGPTDRVFTLAFSGDSGKLACGGGDGTVRLWDVKSGKAYPLQKNHDQAILTIAFSPNGQWLARGAVDGAIHRHELARPGHSLVLATASGEVHALAYAPDGRSLAAAVGRSVLLWDVTSRKMKACLTGHDKKVSCLAFSPDGSRLASGSHDGTVRLWEVAGD